LADKNVIIHDGYKERGSLLLNLLFI